MTGSAEVEAVKAGLYGEAVRAAWLGLVVNAMLAVVKLSAGGSTGLVAMTADGVNSLGDVLTGGVVTAALIYARKPPDAEHPYGHTRAEAVAASHVALLVMVSAVGIGWEACSQLLRPRGALPPTWVMGIAAANVVVKEALYRWKSRVAVRTGSLAILANAWDHRSDALCSLAVLVGLLIVRWGSPHCDWVDEIAALFVVGAILRSAGSLFRRAADELLDVQAEPGFVAEIRTLAESVPGVRRAEKLRVRKSGLEHLVDIHVQVDPELSVRAGHSLGHRVKDRLIERFPTLLDVLVHLEPYDPGGPCATHVPEEP